MPKHHLHPKHGVDHYAGREARKHQEMEDSSMIGHSHHEHHANMPQELIMKDYPRPENYLPEDLDDTIHGVDSQVNEDKSKRSSHFKPKKV
jgi:hypothetical protein